MDVHKIYARLRTASVITFMAIAGASFAGPGNESHGPSQAIADVLRQFTGAEVAFVPAGVIKESGSNANLASYLMYPADGISTVKLSGTQIKKALERSLALYPSAHSGFLQLSGIEVTFSKSAAAESRVLKVSTGGQKLEDSKNYVVAMPSTLAHGGLGYFRVWDRAAVLKEFSGSTLESVLEGKPYRESAPRWIAAN